MSDKEFLQWILDRFYYQHDVNPDSDWMNKLKCIIDDYDSEKITLNILGDD